MKKITVSLIMCGVSFCAEAQSIDPVSLIIAKVIKAIDLQVQKLQNQTIWLQQAQQVAEHELSKLKLSEIADWQNKQKQLYADYFKELSTVKSVIKALPQVRQILVMQAQVVTEYSRFAKEPTLQHSYDALLSLSKDIVVSLQQLSSSSQLSMKDAGRVTLISDLRDAMSDCLDNMTVLNKQYERLAANKNRMQVDMKIVQKLNGKP